ncbi:MAG: RNA polymerase sigma factor [Clostridia bacterium]|nr:RNA polymerase sigma factor [Clostridia bacterium]
MNAEEFQAEAQRIERLLYRIAWSYLDHEQDVEDAVQEGMVKAWEKRDSLKDIRQFKPWVTRILANHCKDVLRKRKRWSFYPLREDIVQVEMQEPEEPLMDAVRQLKPELRAVITLYYMEGYSIPEIAAMLGIPPGTIKTRMRRARKQLGTALFTETEAIR